MLMPLLSVTAIGLVTAVLVVITRHAPPVRALLLGLVGAWAGFAGGAVVGVVVDVIAGTGWMVALAGHVVAVIGAAAAGRYTAAVREGGA
ncbi:hypothetical protein LZ318_06085 [Saccharopolyspora indica]|uniref:hypothetical protein n=1 Tax=Saccharopolyspora indica TaxID=1229659 RepID=UPI0022EA5EC9|nr:hypothetical protein [Saccharopolyspora indica]MDA3648833.1 hypothetical protein [Saccharopolyspora indica]